MFEVYQLAHQVLAMLGYSGDGLVSRNGMSFTAIKALTWGDGALTCKAVIITRH
jgi:hypothetical protein